MPRSHQSPRLLSPGQGPWDPQLVLCGRQAVGSPPLNLSGPLVLSPSQVRGELLQERVRRLEAQEARFAESLVALQFQKVARAAESLSVSTALLSIQDLLLGELSESETLTKAACVQILESHRPVSGAGVEKGTCTICFLWCLVLHSAWNGSLPHVLCVKWGTK